MTAPYVSGWVVRHGVFVKAGAVVTSWWSGPENSWGQNFGPLVDARTGTLSLSVAVFPSRGAARQAMAIVGLKGAVPLQLEVALESFAKRQAS